MAALELGLGRIAFVDRSYAEAERWYDDVVTRFPQSHSPPDAVCRRAVADYKATNGHTLLGKVAEELRRAYPGSVWVSKAIAWLPQEAAKEVA